MAWQQRRARSGSARFGNGMLLKPSWSHSWAPAIYHPLPVPPVMAQMRPIRLWRNQQQPSCALAMPLCKHVRLTWGWGTFCSIQAPVLVQTAAVHQHISSSRAVAQSPVSRHHAKVGRPQGNMHVPAPQTPRCSTRCTTRAAKGCTHAACIWCAARCPLVCCQVSARCPPARTAAQPAQLSHSGPKRCLEGAQPSLVPAWWGPHMHLSGNAAMSALQPTD